MKAVDGLEDIGTSTGLNRQVQWMKTPGLYSSTLTCLDCSTDSKSGNSANAMEAALKSTKAVCFHPVGHRHGLIIENLNTITDCKKAMHCVCQLSTTGGRSCNS